MRNGEKSSSKNQNKEIIEKLDPKEYIGRCPSQVDEFLKDVVSPIVEKYGKEEISEELKV